MTVVARISSFLLTPIETEFFRLQNQAYIITIPKKILEKNGFLSRELQFDLVIENNRISLLGPECTPRETKTTDTFQHG